VSISVVKCNWMKCGEVLQYSEGRSNKVSNIIRIHMDNMKLLLIFILLLSQSLILFRFYFLSLHIWLHCCLKFLCCSMYCLFCVVLCIVCVCVCVCVCKCVLYYCHRVATQLQLTNISYLKCQSAEVRAVLGNFATVRIISSAQSGRIFMKFDIGGTLY
jgi:hypothetical protein